MEIIKSKTPKGCKLSHEIVMQSDINPLLYCGIEPGLALCDRVVKNQVKEWVKNKVDWIEMNLVRKLLLMVVPLNCVRWTISFMNGLKNYCKSIDHQ